MEVGVPSGAYEVILSTTVDDVNPSSNIAVVLLLTLFVCKAL